MRARLRRIWGEMYRHLVLYRRSWPRVVEMAFFPVVEMLVWGFTSRFFTREAAGGGPLAAGMLLGGLLLWEVALRGQMGFSYTFLEEIWSRNLGHVFVSPLRPAELLAALTAMSLVRTVIGVTPAAVLAWGFYHYNLLAIGPVLGLFLANLLLMGWWVALGVIGLILKHGVGAEALAWTVIAAMAPLACVFYPVALLPGWLQPVAWLLPASHVFEGMRTALGPHGVVQWRQIGLAFLLNFCWLAAALWLFAHQFRVARRSGALLTIGE